MASKFALTLGFGVAAATLAACSPSLEVDSPVKVATATEGRAVPTLANVGYIDCVGTAERAPSSVTVDCQHGLDVVEGITWESWGNTRAVGTGTRVQGQGAHTRTFKVRVTLGSPVESGFGQVYSTVTTTHILGK
ncbi:hypothetical protein NQ015_03355 [Corynebacterium sp. 153RC1]|uniref:hypothetical protein n=1 Tax=unclassified Corynebacterium TaxID=2624378 RepID=UPI00211CBACB|nr:MULTISPECIES: hypothetical protein [unclassified Corynebacterium]MCQ9371300.1 hypothetical protein [Corynebacterium sp. 35RC1]MCQ9351908.1 hypothetical protein [Corynebacterium sp. 209RC1]MCQ9353657.1 hypothetical protein [Corynebacterium sp. 1222RC1]MCQ9356359.1 hypothetical protein [Corynebacterium sp. 122RC1]MCQ9358461.1 hypothetical protein [Corynebacterium sp. 142RC1]